MIFCAALRHDNLRSVFGLSDHGIRISFHRFLVLFLRNDGALQRHIRLRDLSLRRGAVSSRVIIAWYIWVHNLDHRVKREALPDLIIFLLGAAAIALPLFFAWTGLHPEKLSFRVREVPVSSIARAN